MTRPSTEGESIVCKRSAKRVDEEKVGGRMSMIDGGKETSKKPGRGMEQGQTLDFRVIVRIETKKNKQYRKKGERHLVTQAVEARG
jgi:hypothetical protein